MYGNRDTSLFSTAEVQGQLALACLWALSLLILLVLSLTTRSTTTSPNNTAAAKAARITLHLSLFLLFVAHVLLAVRFGLIIAESDVPVAYRFESSVVVLAWRLGLTALFIAAGGLLGLQKSRVVSTAIKAVYWGCAIVYGVLSVAYVALDFVVSADGLEGFKDGWVWLLGDRDFSLLMNADMVTKVKTGTTGSGLAGGYVFDRMWDMDEGAVYQKSRDGQVKIGVALAVLGLVMAVGLVVAGVWLFIAGKRGPVDNVLAARKRAIWVFITAAGLLLATLFDVVVSGHYMLHNWNTITNGWQWRNFLLDYPSTEMISGTGDVPDIWLADYRVTPRGFPVAAAFLEPFGVVIAAAALVLLLRARARETSVARDIVFRETKG